MILWKKILLLLVLLGAAGLWLLSRESPLPTEFSYGVSFSRFHADELGLDWKETYLALLDDLGVRRFRFSAHWPLTEPRDGVYNFRELDFQMAEARERDAAVILAVGRRLPGWPECHIPDWAAGLSRDAQQEKLLSLIEKIVDRYKGYDNLEYWQVENEPYLSFFGRSHCGSLDEDFLEKEITLVRERDPSHPVLLTDSGEFGTWYGAYMRGDTFGSTMYLYVWSRQLGPLRYPIPPAFFRIKRNLTKLFFGEKDMLVIELGMEPWLLQPIVDTPPDVQFGRMGLDKFQEMIFFSRKTGFDTFYLWGAEWWYWLKANDYPEHWEAARRLFSRQ